LKGGNALQASSYRVADWEDNEIQAFNQQQSAKIVDIRKKQLKREQSKKVAKQKFFVTFQTAVIILTLAAMFSLIVYRNSLVNEAKYDIFNMKSEIKSLNSDIEELSAAIENQTDIKTVEKIAIEELNMQYPKAEQYIYIGAPYYYALTKTDFDVAETDDTSEFDESKKDISIMDTISALFKSN